MVSDLEPLRKMVAEYRQKLLPSKESIITALDEQCKQYESTIRSQERAIAELCMQLQKSRQKKAGAACKA
eukprot:tig00000829_g4651.t1